MVSSTPRPHFTPGKEPVPILQEAGWAPGPVWTGGKSRSHRDSILDRPARSQSLYRLSYRAHNIHRGPFVNDTRIYHLADCKICSFPAHIPKHAHYISDTHNAYKPKPVHYRIHKSSPLAFCHKQIYTKSIDLPQADLHEVNRPSARIESSAWRTFQLVRIILS